METVEAIDIEAYLKLIKQKKDENILNGNVEDFLFRGQTADYPLLPKLGRLKAKGDLKMIERQMLDEFKRTNPLLIESQRPMDDWDYLTLGQHYGLPTRLLDWSKNALTALWFATAENSSIIMENVSPVIWILMPCRDDFEIETGAIHPFDVPETRIVQPRIIKQRINNQSGVFSVHSTADILQKRNLNEADSYAGKLIKVVIPPERLKDIRTDLNTVGINAFTIYPELEGLCSYLQWRYFE